MYHHVQNEWQTVALQLLRNYKYQAAGACSDGQLCTIYLQVLLSMGGLHL